MPTRVGGHINDAPHAHYFHPRRRASWDHTRETILRESKRVRDTVVLAFKPIQQRHFVVVVDYRMSNTTWGTIYDRFYDTGSGVSTAPVSEVRPYG